MYEGELQYDGDSLKGVYFLLTNKFIIRERFYTILFNTKLEILNDELLLPDENTWEIYNVVKEYSYKMKDEKNIEEFDLQKFANLMKSKFKEMQDSFKKNIDKPHEYLYHISEIDNTRIKRFYRESSAPPQEIVAAILGDISL